MRACVCMYAQQRGEDEGKRMHVRVLVREGDGTERKVVSACVRERNKG